MHSCKIVIELFRFHYKVIYDLSTYIVSVKREVPEFVIEEGQGNFVRLASCV
jgi:hypothetical protein